MPQITISLTATELRMLDASVRKWNTARAKGIPPATRSILLQDAMHSQFGREFPEYQDRLDEAMQELVGGLRKRVRPKQLKDQALQVGQTVLLVFLDELDKEYADSGAPEGGAEG